MLPIKQFIILISLILPLIHAAATSGASVSKKKKKTSPKKDVRKKKAASLEKTTATEMDLENHQPVDASSGPEDGLSFEDLSPQFIQYFLMRATEEQLAEALQAKQEKREAQEHRGKGTTRTGRKTNRRKDEQKKGTAQNSKKHEAPVKCTEENAKLFYGEHASSETYRQLKQSCERAFEEEIGVEDAELDMCGQQEEQEETESITSVLAGLINEGVAEKQYHLGKLIRSGANGMVYQGSHTGRKSKLAIKVIPLVSAISIWAVNWELYALETVRHNSVVKLHSAYLSKDERSIYIAMPFVKGKRLYDWINWRAKKLRRRNCLIGGDAKIMPLRTAKNVARQLFLGLNAIHKAELSHGSIDTSSIRIENPRDSQNAKIRIVDLGNARSNDVEKMEADIIRMAFVVLELGMKPEDASTPQLQIAGKHYGGALISVPRWTDDVDVARIVFAKAQSGEIDVYPELLDFVNYVVQLDSEKQLTIDRVFEHEYLA